MAYALKAAIPRWRTLRGLGELVIGVCVTFHGTLTRQRRYAHDPDRYLELPDVQHRPDPLLYAQHYLLTNGLAVTWDNPDIELYERSPDGTAADPRELGTPVPSGRVEPGRRYLVRVRVWNGSYDAPAVGLPVHLSWLPLGAGAVAHPVGTDHITLGVKASSRCPAFATFDWTAPADPGEYGLQVLLGWPDDANPDNNLGQHHVSVGRVADRPERTGGIPGATRSSTSEAFRFVVRNPASVPRRVVFEADTYALPQLPLCTGEPDVTRFANRLAESEARWRVMRGRHRRENFPVPAGWRVVYEPSEPVLGPGAEQEITVYVEAPEPSASGPSRAAAPSALNVNAFAVDERSRTHVGGVTLRLTRGAQA